METVKKLLLTSSPYLSQNITNLIVSSIGNEVEKCKAAIIPTAARELKKNQNGAKGIYKIFTDCGFKEVELIDIEFENPQILIDFDLIFMTGGDPFYLLMQLKRSGADNILKELYARGVFLAGSSAGAMVYGKDIRLAKCFNKLCQQNEQEDLSGLSLLPSLVLPHTTFLRKEYPYFEKRVSECENQAGFPVLFIDDDEAILILNGVAQSFSL